MILPSRSGKRNPKFPIAVSHRGNTEGAQPSDENHPEYVSHALRNYRVEVDAWKIGEAYYLGHDDPMHEIDKFFLFDNRLLVHCKNTDAFVELSRHRGVECFFQNEEQIVLSNHGNHVVNENVVDGFHSRHPSYAVDVSATKDLRGFKNLLGVVTDFPLMLQESGLRAEPPTHPDLIIMDVDGVLTRGAKAYDLAGNAVSKDFCDLDFTAIKRFRAAGVSVALLSGDERNAGIAEKRNLPFYFARSANGNIDKAAFLPKLAAEFDADSVAYVGDDYYDLTLLESVEWSFAPSTASHEVKNTVEVVLKAGAGEGVIAEIFEHFKPYLMTPFAYDSSLK